MKDVLVKRMRKLTHIFIEDGVVYDSPIADTIEDLDMKNFDKAYKDYNCIVVENGNITKVIIGSIGNAKLLKETIREYKESR